MLKEHCMTDLETMDTIASSIILSIGAVMFDKEGMSSSQFYTVVNYKSCVELGLTESESTRDFWNKQKISNPDAYEVVRKAEAGEGVDIHEALEDLSRWFKDCSINGKLWGNGADFDNPILNYAYTKAGIAIPWEPSNGRCYRTMKAAFNGVKAIRQGVYHNALDDAKTQAVHLIEIANSYGFPLN